MAEFYDAVPEDELPDESAAVVEVNGTEIALVKSGGKVFALANECTHAGMPIGEGDVIAENVVECPGHGGAFNITTGDVVNGPPDEPLETYEVQIVDGMVRVAIE